MPTPAELEARFWDALKSDMTMMLGLDAVEDGHARPMTAIIEGQRGPIWFFTSRDNSLTQLLGANSRAIATFVDKGHDLFATVQGDLSLDTNRAVVDRLWNPHIAAWYEGGKDDPQLALLRLDPDSAEIWINENSVFAGIKALLGRDPKQDYEGKVAEVRFD